MRDIYSPLLCHKLQHTTVRWPLLVAQFEQHWIADVQSCQLLQRRGRHDNLSTVFDFLTVFCGEYHRVAAVPLKKNLGMPDTKIWVATTETKECSLCMWVCGEREGGGGRKIQWCAPNRAKFSPQPERDLHTYPECCVVEIINSPLSSSWRRNRYTHTHCIDNYIILHVTHNTLAGNWRSKLSSTICERRSQAKPMDYREIGLVSRGALVGIKFKQAAAVAKLYKPWRDKCLVYDSK